jgi:hypothetical protein
MGNEAFAPLADGVAIAAQFGGDLLVGRTIGSGGPHDDAAAEGQCLRGGSGAEEGLDLVPGVVRQFDGRTKGARHGWPPDEQDSGVVPEAIMRTYAPIG